MNHNRTIPKFDDMNTPTIIKKVLMIGAIALASTLAPSTVKAETVPVMPSAPQNIKVSVKGTTAKISWTAPKSAGTSAIEDYTVSTRPGEFACSTESLTCSITGLDAGQVYTFYVQAVSAAGLGELGSVSNVVLPYGFQSLGGKKIALPSKPAASFGSNTVINVANGAVHVGLVVPRASKASAQIIRYTVQLFDSSNVAVVKSANGAKSTLPTTITAAAAPGTYKVYVTAQKRNGSKVTWAGPTVRIG